MTEEILKQVQNDREDSEMNSGDSEMNSGDSEMNSE
jgi:hypothetical protein